MSSLRVATRIALRDALAHRLRSVLVMVLVGLPVLVVTAGLVIFRTADVTDVEALDRELGSADAYVRAGPGAPVTQDVSPFRGGESWWTVDEGEESASPDGPVDTTPVADVLGPDTRLVPHAESQLLFRKEDGDLVWLRAVEVDLRDEITDGMFTLTEGRLPAGSDEVVVNPSLLNEGYAVGDELPVAAGLAPTIVGVGDDATVFDSGVAYGPGGSMIADPDPRLDETRSGWLVETGDVSWADVVELNGAGFAVLSRAVVTDLPSLSEMGNGYHHDGQESFSDETVAVVGLVAVMVLLEVALLAGPAFAVTARRQARTLALVATAGGTPAQARRVVVAQGAVLGAGASLAGVLLGVPAGAALLPVFQRLDGGNRFGPLEVPWLWIGGVALCGVLAVLLAAVFPAWVTARQDPVAALAGRRSDPSPRLRHPLVGLALVALGVVGTFYGTTRGNQGEFFIAASTVVVVLGMVLVVPVLLVALSRLVRDLPFTVRFAARDAARHRTRTVPAVVAVAATVAGVVALGISVASDTARAERMYSPTAPPGSTAVYWSEDAQLAGDQVVSRGEALARIEPLVAEVSGEQPVRLQGLVAGEQPEGRRYEEWAVLTDASQEESLHLRQHSPTYGTSVLVSDDVRLLALDEEQADEAAAALAEGKVVVPTHEEVDADTVVLRHVSVSYEVDEGEQRKVLDEFVLPAHYLLVRGDFLPTPNVEALVPTALADERKLPVVDTALHLTDGLDRDQEKALEKAFEAEGLWSVGMSTERGFEDHSDTSLALLILGAGAWVLMLVGTLTAAFLALSDAQGDLATLGAVGGEPKVRRRVAGSYALLVAGAGAVLGTLIGVVPGLAMPVLQRQRTTEWGWGDAIAGVTPLVVDIPWLLIAAVVVGLPLLTAAVMWASARSRLPMVARLE